MRNKVRQGRPKQDGLKLAMLLLLSKTGVGTSELVRERTGDAMVVSTRRTTTKTAPAAAVGERPTGQVKTLMKGLAVLEMIMMRETVRTTDVAATFGIDKGSASRILRTLAQSGFVASGKGRRYTLGPKLARASSRRSSGAALRATARGLLESLVEQTGESAHLGILADGQVLYLDRADSEAPLRVERPVGTLAPLHCTALGKVFLAFGNATIPTEMPGLTVRTITDPELMRVHLRQVVSQGYAIDDEEFGMGICCVAAPLRDANGQVVAALGLSGPTARVNLTRTKELGELVKKTAEQFGLS
jgi:DNA-binding IclR family transcriptional regulator